MNIDPLKIPSSVSIVVVKILYILHERGDREDINPTILAELAGSHKVSVSEFLYKLEKQDLIVRRDHPEDRRQSLVTLSRKGRERLASWQSNLSPSIA